MISILSMKKVGRVGNLSKIQFIFEFDNASNLPMTTYLLGTKNYLIANNSKAKNISTDSYYNYIDGRWLKVSAFELPRPNSNYFITDNGEYEIVNNEFDGYNDINVSVNGGGATPILINKNITANGTYTATDDNANGYSTVNVTVSNTYTIEDNGKVVNNQELVAQTAYPTDITQNNTYDTTNYNSITVNVSGGSSSVVAICTFDFSENQFFMEDESGNIGIDAFSGWEILTSITIPSGVTGIEAGAFSNCSALETVTFEANSSIETIGDYAFNYCYALSSITIPSSVTSIGREAFYYCSALSSIIIPSGVTSIGDEAFGDCESLETLTFESTTPPELGGDLGILSTCIIRVPQGTLSDYTSAANYPDPSEYTYEEY